MNSKITLPIIVLVLIVAAGGVYAYLQSDKVATNSKNFTNLANSEKNSKTSDAPSAPLVEKAPSNLDFKGNIVDLIDRGGSVVCDWDGEVSGSLIKGKTYINNGKLSAEGKMTTKGVTSNVNLVANKDSATGWMTIPVINQKVGYKIDISKLKEYSNSSDAVKKQAYEQAKKTYSFKCSEWSVDESKFKVPTDIKFYN